MSIQDECRFTPQHIWIRSDGEGAYLVGITDYAQQMLGDIVFVEPPEIGSQLTAAGSCGLVESVKTASDLHAPISGKVLEVNQALQSTPELINDQPYLTWIFRLSPEYPDALEYLLDAAQYQASLSLH
jgi:glycine cleavage system H protein